MVKEFCPKQNISPDQLKERLRILEASIAAIQGTEYINLLLRVQDLSRFIASEEELQMLDSWYLEYMRQDSDFGFGFETYEPDEGKLPSLIENEQRLRDTGNAFTNFFVDTMKGKTIYTESFSGKRARASSPQMDNWLTRDPDWHIEPPASYQERVEQFRAAYIQQTKLRKEAEEKLQKMVVNRMDAQDAALISGRFIAPPREFYDSEEGEDGSGSGSNSRVLSFNEEN